MCGEEGEFGHIVLLFEFFSETGSVASHNPIPFHLPIASKIKCVECFGLVELHTGALGTNRL